MTSDVCDPDGASRPAKGAGPRRLWSNKKLTRRYNAKVPTFKNLEHEAGFILGAACEPYGDRVYSVKSRVKTLESVAQKAERKQLAEPLESMFDIVGLRVVCLYRSDLAEMRKTIEESFQILEVDDKAGDQADPSAFNYESIHFKAVLPGTCGGPRYEGLVGEPFEIQLRTLAMDSWATISHNLAYKKGWDLPDELQRDFHAVAALLHLADKHFDDVYRHVKKQRAAATTALSTGKPKLQTKVNPYSIAAYLRWKFPERDHVADSSVGDFAQSLVSHGIHTLGALNRLVDVGLPDVLAEEVGYLKQADESDKPYYWRDLAAARVAVRRADPTFEAEAAAQEEDVVRASALESMPVPMAVFRDLVIALVTEPSVVNSCEGNLDRTNAFLNSVAGIDVDETIQWLEDYGGSCDCEVLYNVAALFEDDDAA